MQKLEFTVQIHAAVERVWQILCEQDENRKWLAALDEGTYFVGTWAEGSIMKFLDSHNNGMYNLVERNILYKELKMKHVGWLINGELSPQNWEDSTVAYILESNEKGTLLKCEVNSLDEFVSFFESKYPQNFIKIKQLAESV